MPASHTYLLLTYQFQQLSYQVIFVDTKQSISGILLCDRSQSSTPSVNGRAHFCTRRLRSRNLSVPAARKLLNELSKISIRASQWINYKQNAKYSEGQSKLRLYVPKPSTRSLDVGLLIPAWVRLNRFRTSVERFQLSMDKWGLAPTSICEFVALDQTAAHVILEYHYIVYGMLVLHDETECWLNNFATSIWRSEENSLPLEKKALMSLLSRVVTCTS